jgi:U6 snRNA-associated Sm-like protein LSm7
MERGHARSSRGRGGRGGSRGGHQGSSQSERPKKENILDLNRFIDKQMRVKFSGGREGIRPRPPVCLGRWLTLLAAVVGILKGFDQLMNVVLDDVKEIMRGMYSPYSVTWLRAHCLGDDDGNETTRALGLVVARSTLLVLISPVDGSEEIENPFLQADED